MPARSSKPLLEIRPPTRAEIPAISRLAAKLVRQHRSYDPQRFFALEDPAAGYAWYFNSVLGKRKVVILGAFEGKKVVGYAYATMMPRDWDLLRDRCGGFHDLFVDERARSRGVGRALAVAVIERLRELGAPRVVLNVSPRNERALRIFERFGFRPTMLEMTKEL